MADVIPAEWEPPAKGSISIQVDKLPKNFLMSLVTPGLNRRYNLVLKAVIPENTMLNLSPPHMGSVFEMDFICYDPEVIVDEQ